MPHVPSRWDVGRSKAVGSPPCRRPGHPPGTFSTGGHTPLIKGDTTVHVTATAPKRERSCWLAFLPELLPGAGFYLHHARCTDPPRGHSCARVFAAPATLLAPRRSPSQDSISYKSHPLGWEGGHLARASERGRWDGNRGTQYASERGRWDGNRGTQNHDANRGTQYHSCHSWRSHGAPPHKPPTPLLIISATRAHK